MKILKKSMILLGTLVISASSFAHFQMVYTPNSDVTNEKNVEFKLMFTHPADGVEILLVEDKEAGKEDKSFEGKKILYKGALNEEGSSDVLKANVVSYQVVFNAGPGHTVYKPGMRISVDEREEWQEKIEEKREEAKAANDTEMLKWLDLIENKQNNIRRGQYNENIKKEYDIIRNTCNFCIIICTFPNGIYTKFGCNKREKC
eukprot:TRINITY_DN42113_c0_g1_i1.p2 TRINITY_DN42113_c0_g1~~TRINITY_DN42113_c0_g1_i1.p2  ORF type:complete len:203 (+),score=29.75 TRINITY_DN42113_c0_g1_i1:349-957(+)